MSRVEEYHAKMTDKLTPVQRRYSEDISSHIVDRFAWGFGWATGMTLSGGWFGFFLGLLFFVFYVIIGSVTLGVYDRIVQALCYFSLSIMALNWFFDDIWKTVALPVAFIFYHLGKRKCPDIIKEILNFYEKGILGRTLTKSEQNQRNSYIKTGKRKNTSPGRSIKTSIARRKAIAKGGNKKTIYYRQALRSRQAQRTDIR